MQMQQMPKKKRNRFKDGLRRLLCGTRAGASFDPSELPHTSTGMSSPHSSGAVHKPEPPIPDVNGSSAQSQLPGTISTGPAITDLVTSSAANHSAGVGAQDDTLRSDLQQSVSPSPAVTTHTEAVASPALVPPSSTTARGRLETIKGTLKTGLTLAAVAADSFPLAKGIITGAQAIVQIVEVSRYVSMSPRGL